MKRRLAWIFVSLGLACERAPVAEAPLHPTEPRGAAPACADAGATCADQREAGAARCSASIVLAHVKGRSFATWLDAYAALTRDLPPPQGPTPTNRDQAKDAICGARCDGAGPWLVTMGTLTALSESRTHLVAVRDDGSILVFPNLGLSSAGRCSWEDQSTEDVIAPGLIHVHVVHAPLDLHNPAGLPNDVANPEVGCLIEGWTEIDSYFDIALGERLLEVEEGQSGLWVADVSKRRRVVQIDTRDGTRARVRGGGCDRDLPLRGVP